MTRTARLVLARMTTAAAMSSRRLSRDVLLRRVPAKVQVMPYRVPFQNPVSHVPAPRSIGGIPRQVQGRVVRALRMDTACGPGSDQGGPCTLESIPAERGHQ